MALLFDQNRWATRALYLIARDNPQSPRTLFNVRSPWKCWSYLLSVNSAYHMETKEVVSGDVLKLSLRVSGKLAWWGCINLTPPAVSHFPPSPQLPPGCMFGPVALSTWANSAAKLKLEPSLSTCQSDTEEKMHYPGKLWHHKSCHDASPTGQELFDAVLDDLLNNSHVTFGCPSKSFWAYKKLWWGWMD